MTNNTVQVYAKKLDSLFTIDRLTFDHKNICQKNAPLNQLVKSTDNKKMRLKLLRFPTMYLIYHYYICLAAIAQDFFTGRSFLILLALEDLCHTAEKPDSTNSLTKYKLPYHTVVLKSCFNSGHNGRNHNLLIMWSRGDSIAGLTEDFLLSNSVL